MTSQEIVASAIAISLGAAYLVWTALVPVSPPDNERHDGAAVLRPSFARRLIMEARLPNGFTRETCVSDIEGIQWGAAQAGGTLVKATKQKWRFFLTSWGPARFRWRMATEAECLALVR